LHFRWDMSPKALSAMLSKGSWIVRRGNIPIAAI
jgi:hypothetical protein